MKSKGRVDAKLKHSMHPDLTIAQFISNPPKGKDADRAFRELTLDLFLSQFRLNPAYATFCRAQGSAPASVADWKTIPAMPAAGFKEFVLTTFPIKKAVRVFRTSGTTGEKPGAHYFETLKFYNAAAVPVFEEYFLPDRKKLDYHFLMASPKETPHSSLSYMMGLVNRRFASSEGKFYVRNGKLLSDELIRVLLGAKRPIAVLATAFSLKSFLDELKLKKITLKLPKGSRLMETGGFKGRMKSVTKNELYRLCGQRLGIPRTHCVSEYGMTELSSQFYDTTLKDHCAGIRRRPFKRGPAWTRVLIIDPRTGKEAKRGKVGLIRIFDLANRGSVLAIQTEDLGYAVGDGFECIGRMPSSELRGCSLSYENLLAL